MDAKKEELKTEDERNWARSPLRWPAITMVMLSLITSVFSVGYSYRGVTDMKSEVSDIKSKGSTSSQLTAKDVEWIRVQLTDIKAQMNRVEDKIDAHASKK
jgi:hypothetical protein